MRFVPIYKEKVWGGRKLERFVGRKIPPGVPIGESWEISDHGGDVSSVANGPLAGASLRECIGEDPEAVLGKSIAARGWDRFPLLVKLIDAADRLSVQVHPGDAYAARNEAGEWGKTEIWFVMQADEGAELICGLTEGVDRKAFERAIEEGRVSECLARVKVSEGDVVFIPAGRVHAIGAGNLILEIQENSDVTYRVYDWDRMGMDGRPRELHIRKAVEVIDFADEGGALVRKVWEEAEGVRRAPLTDCRYFRITQLDIPERWESACDGERFVILSTVRGSARLRWGDGGEMTIAAGDNILLPAAMGAFTVEAEGNGCSILRTEVP